MPDTLLFETLKEPFNDAVLFRRGGRDELLLQPIIVTSLPEPVTLKDQPASIVRFSSSVRLRRANS